MYGLGFLPNSNLLAPLQRSTEALPLQKKRGRIDRA
jgi:hypothetical protein